MAHRYEYQIWHRRDESQIGFRRNFVLNKPRVPKNRKPEMSPPAPQVCFGKSTLRHNGVHEAQMVWGRVGGRGLLPCPPDTPAHTPLPHTLPLLSGPSSLGNSHSRLFQKHSVAGGRSQCPEWWDIPIRVVTLKIKSQRERQRVCV